MNGGAQLGAVTRAYNYRQKIIVKGVFPAEVLSGPLAHVRSGPPMEVWGMLPRKFMDFKLSEMVSDALFKRKKSLPMPNPIT